MKYLLLFMFIWSTAISQSILTQSPVVRHTVKDMTVHILAESETTMNGVKRDSIFIFEANKLRNKFKDIEFTITPFYKDTMIVSSCFRSISPGDIIIFMGHNATTIGGIELSELGRLAFYCIADKSNIECYIGSCYSDTYMAQDFTKESGIPTTGYSDLWWGPVGENTDVLTAMYGWVREGKFKADTTFSKAKRYSLYE